MERLIDWDVKISDGRISYFDPELSYEATGYRPINDIEGLDFDPKLFTKTAKAKRETGKYCPYRFGTKEFREFWTEEGWRCREGITINGYTLTGDNYYFINFYQLLSLDVPKAGEGRSYQTPDFYVEQYKYFHYVELCRIYGYNACTLKARGIGWSEINASMVANMYTWRPNTRSLITAYSDFYVNATVKKAFDQLDYLNSETEGGMRRLRQVKDQALFRRASHVAIVDGQKVESGQRSEIVGLVVDEPRKMRSDRVEILLMDEGGSWPDSEKAYEQAKSLVELQGRRVGNVFIFGTGGDKGPNLAGLKEIFNNPVESDILGYKHKNTRSGEPCITGYFVPAWSIVRDLMDERGYTSEKDGKAYFQKERDRLAPTPKKLLLNCAEKCWYPEEALALEGDDRFNTALLTEQKTRIITYKQTPKEWLPKYGRLDYIFRGGKVEEQNIDGIEFVPTLNGDVCIIEPPMQTEDGKVYKNLYVAGIDGIDFGGEDTSEATKNGSDFCIVIKKRMQGLKEPMYVAYYRARPERVKEAYIQALRLIQWYNAKALIEKTRIGFLSWMDSKKMKYKYMMRKPKALEPDKSKPSSGNNPFGAPATDSAIQHGLGLIADYVEEYCQMIWIPEMIDELINYSYKDKKKFDMVAAMQMAELADEELSSTAIQTEDSSFRNNNQKIAVYGYYIDERGYKRRGRIELEKKKTPAITFESEQYGDGRIYHTNPLFNGDIE